MVAKDGERKKRYPTQLVGEEGETAIRPQYSVRQYNQKKKPGEINIWIMVTNFQFKLILK
jgi:hypothetical protein